MDFLAVDRHQYMHADTTTPVTAAFSFPVIVFLRIVCVSAPSTAYFDGIVSVHFHYGPYNLLTSPEEVSFQERSVLLLPSDQASCPPSDESCRGGSLLRRKIAFQGITQQDLSRACRSLGTKRPWLFAEASPGTVRHISGVLAMRLADG